MAKVIKISHTLSEVWDICAIIYKSTYFKSFRFSLSSNTSLASDGDDQLLKSLHYEERFSIKETIF